LRKLGERAEADLAHSPRAKKSSKPWFKKTFRYVQSKQEVTE
jgi:hypothetical protein